MIIFNYNHKTIPMRIAYLHGLESDNLGKKNDWLHANYIVYDPLINYKERGIFAKVLRELSAFKPDLIVGSSMGGYFAYEMAKIINKPMLLLNPALHARSMQPDVPSSIRGSANPKMHCILGVKDSVVNPKETIKFLNREYSQRKWTYDYQPHAHRTPFEVYKTEVTKFLSRL